MAGIYFERDGAKCSAPIHRKYQGWLPFPTQNWEPNNSKGMQTRPYIRKQAEKFPPWLLTKD